MKTWLTLWFAKILAVFEINNIATALLPVPRQDFKTRLK
jgi:hypothetical protein